MAAHAGAFGDLRKLADWFLTSPQCCSLHIERLTMRLGATCIPLLGRELYSADPRRRDAARECLVLVASHAKARERVLEELRRILDTALVDELKVCALGLLAELGEHAQAQFADPGAMQRRSALALAAQLDTAGDVANAADMMVRKLAADDIAQMIEVLAKTCPAAAQRLAHELANRLDLDLLVRERVVAMASKIDVQPASRARTPRPTHVAVLANASARLVVVASRKISGERRWRRWAVLVAANGQIEDCFHEEATPGKHGADADASPLVASLVADGYHVASTDLDHARTVVATAARLAVSRTRCDPSCLPSAYYLGRDLLDLGDAHMGPRRDPSTLALARAIELIADGDVARALGLLCAQEPATADHAAAVAACALAQGRHADAIEPLGRAIAKEPAWPLHHWNLAVAFHGLGDAASCYHALRRFLAASARPTALHGDPDQLARIGRAERMLGELERAARLAGKSLARRRRAKRGAQ